MPYPSLEDYKKLAEEHDLIPVCKEILADMETPVSVLARMVEHKNAFLLESLEGGETWGRYSFLGIDPELLFEIDHAKNLKGGLQQLRDVYKDLKVAEVEGIPPFFGGAVGFLSYEAIGEFERMPEPKLGVAGMVPRTRFLKADKIIAFDNLRHTVKIVVCTKPKDGISAEEIYSAATIEIDEIAKLIMAPHSASTETKKHSDVEFSSNMNRDKFKEMVTTAKQYIFDGDIIQVVLSQRFSAKTDLPPLQIYRALRLLNPSPYTFFLKIGDQTLVGSSPEVMVRLTGSKVEVRPIAGTRPRGKSEQEDHKLADELLSDEKERAEHVMLVDLGRNDVGRVAESGSVQVTEYMVIERYSHVMHLVSHVQGIVRKEFDAYDVVKATFPAGTLSGAPKIRAMEIINEQEPGPRGAYGGAVGYVSYNGNMDLAITIRTLDISNGTVAVQAGAGIVYDSDPDMEYEETCHKAKALLHAIDMAANGLEIF